MEGRETGNLLRVPGRKRRACESHITVRRPKHQQRHLRGDFFAPPLKHHL